MSLVGVNSVSTPGVKALSHQILSDEDLEVGEHTRFRALAARADYLAADRPDCQFAAKEICRDMAAPTELSNTALKRLVRYLRLRPRLVYSYAYQDSSELNAYSDTDWAGCVRTRKSTSGGCLMLGSHLRKS